MYPSIDSCLIPSHRRDLEAKAAAQRLALEAWRAAREARQSAGSGTRRPIGVLGAVRLAGLRVF
jgi:hypothetical protein